MTVLTRAYSAFEVRSIDTRARRFTGIATTPATDRMGDTINPLGATFKNPTPLLWKHQHDAPIGEVIFDTPTSRGIAFEASMPVVPEPGPLKDRVDTAWGEIVHGLVRAVSVGFRAIRSRPNKGGGIDYEAIELIELSTVSIPANSEAVITGIKALLPDGRLTSEAVRLLAAANRPGIPLVRVERPSFYTP